MLTGNLLTLSVIQGLFTASDTLAPQAFGARNYREVGRLAIRGFVVALLLIMPVNLLLVFFMHPILTFFGQDDEPAALATQWYQIYVLGLPFYALYWTTWKFLAAQEIMGPVLLVLSVACGIILPISLEFFINRFGFLGSALALVTYLVSQSMMLLLYIAWTKPHHPLTWAGFSFSEWRQALEWKPMWEYFRLGSGGILSSSEWWYWEVLCLMVGSLGVLSMDIQTIPTQVMAVGFMVPAGIGTALAVRLGANLAENPKRAKQLGFYGLTGSCGLFAVLSLLLYVFRQFIFELFTDDPVVTESCDKIWWKVVAYFFNLCVFGVTVGVASSLGLQWTQGLVTTIILWVFGLPAVFYFAIHQNGGLDIAWTCIYPPYVVMNLCMMITFFRTDWDAVSDNIRQREGLEEPLLSAEADMA